jgi:hypothetical protein
MEGFEFMKVLLIDADSTVPNLALMKLSAWHKSRGDQVSFFEPEPDRIYGSVIFKKNKHLLSGIQTFYPNAEIILGGSGHDLKSKLPDEVEAMCPDYSLYPEMDYSLGFTTRGCIRRCYFCVVPEKEGRLVRWQHPSQWVRHKKAMLLDNNWMADKEWFMETSQWFIDNDIALMENGLDIRLLDEDRAKRLSEIRWAKPIHFAFDDLADEQAVLDGLKMLDKVGISIRSKVSIYVYCHDDKHFDSAKQRCDILKEAGTTAFVMNNYDGVKSQRMKDLARWANRPWLFWSIPFEKYGAIA